MPSRLSRFRGKLLNTVAKLYWATNRQQYLSDRPVLCNCLQQIEGDCQQIVASMVNQHSSVIEIGRKPSTITESIKSPESASLNLGQDLKQVTGVVSKIANDVPRVVEMIGVKPTLYQCAKINLEVAKLLQGVRLLRDISQDTPLPQPRKTRKDFDPFGIGARYEQYLSSAYDETRFTFSIATHKNPDADALVSSWLASRYGLVNDNARIAFVGRGANPKSLADHYFVVDIGKTHDVLNRRFDRKPPAFANRDETCATRLVWDWLLQQELGSEERKNLIKLKSFVSLVHDRDAVSRRARSPAYKESREAGFPRTWLASESWQNQTRCSPMPVSCGLIILVVELPLRLQPANA